MPTTPPIKVPLVGEDKYSREFQKMTKQIAKMGRAVAATGKMMTASLTVPIVAAGTAAVKMATDLNKSMASVGTLIPKQTAELESFREKVMAIGVETGTTFDVVAEGLYETISAFGSATDPINKLTLASKMARAGLATVKESLSLVSAVTKGYGDTSDEAAQSVADMSFLTVKLGQTTFPELAASMGKVVPLFSTLKIKQTEMFGAMATLTGVTGTASEVSTQLASAMGAIIKPSAAMKSAVKDLGFASSVAMVKELGLAGSLDVLNKHVKGDTIALGELFTRKEGLLGVTALLGSQADDFAEKTRAMTKATGATDEAFKAQTKGINKVGFAFEQSVLKIKKFMIQLGDKLMPIVARFVDKLSPFMDKMSGVSDKTLELGIKLAGIVAAIGPVLFIVGKLTGLISGLSGAIAGAGGLSAVMAAVTGPIGLTVAAIAAATAAVIYFWDELESVRQSVAGPFIELFDDLKSAFTTVSAGADGMTATLSPLVRILSKLLSPLSAVAVRLALLPVKVVTSSLKFMAPVARVLISGFKLLGKALNFAYTWTVALVTKFLEGTTVGRGLAKVFSFVGDTISTVWDYVKGLWGTVTDFFSGIAGYMDKLGLKLDAASAKYGGVKELAAAGVPETFDGAGNNDMSYETDLLYNMEQSRASESNITLSFEGLPEGVVPTVSKSRGANVTAERGTVMGGA